MALNQAQVNKLYNDLLGRNATFGDASDFDADYWLKDHSYEQAKRGIESGSEFKNRQSLVTGAGDAGISEANLDKMVLPGGWKTEHYTGYDKATQGDLFDFNKGNTWVSSTGDGNAWAKEQNKINKVLGASGANNYSTTIPGVDGSGVTDGSTIPVDTGTGTGDTGTGDTGTGDTGTGDPKYLTSQGLTDWWDKLDKPWLTQADDTTANTSGNDDFMKMMMFMAMMRPQGGGGGFGQYGYGGLNPGGVQSAYNPMANLSGYMDAFKTLPGLSSSTISTGNN